MQQLTREPEQVTRHDVLSHLRICHRMINPSDESLRRSPRFAYAIYGLKIIIRLLHSTLQLSLGCISERQSSILIGSFVVIDAECQIVSKIFSRLCFLKSGSYCVGIGLIFVCIRIGCHGNDATLKWFMQICRKELLLLSFFNSSLYPKANSGMSGIGFGLFVVLFLNIFAVLCKPILWCILWCSFDIRWRLKGSFA